MSSFILKIIAAVTMFIDHMGLMLFPGQDIFRIIGRLAFPIFAYCIAEGFRYTKNRMRYFLRIFLLGLLCQIVYTVVDRKPYLGILLTFSLSIIVMFFMECVRVSHHGLRSMLAEWIKRCTNKTISNAADRTLSMIMTCVVVAAMFILTLYVDVDYGFFGIMLPAFTNLFREKGKRFVMFCACLLALCIDLTSVFPLQYWSLLTIPLIALYNGKPGKHRMKYFFYIFYPAHLVLLYALSLIF